MRRARWTMLAAAGLVLMGSDGAVRSDCPPANQGCTLPPGGWWDECLWDTIYGQACQQNSTPPCGCVKMACTGFTWTAANAGQFVTSWGNRPAGCCNDISWGWCHVEMERLCGTMLPCLTLIGHTPYFCTPNNPCHLSEDDPQPIYRVGTWLLDGQSCCFDSQ